MAKVTGPLFSVDASGKLADSIVFSKWRGIHTVRQWAKPANPNTAGQQVVRTAFSATVDDYHILSGDDKQAWSLRASGQPLSGFNLLMGKSIKAKTEIDGFNLMKSVAAAAPTTVAEFGASISITPKYGGTARLMYGTKAGVYFDEQEITLTAGIEVSAEVIGLVEGTKYFYRIVQDQALVETDEIRGSTGDYSFTALATA